MEIRTERDIEIFLQKQEEEKLIDNIFDMKNSGKIKNEDPRVTKLNYLKTYYNMYEEGQVLEKMFDMFPRKFYIVKKYEFFAHCKFVDEDTYNFGISYFDLYTQRRIKLYEKNRL